ncbi:histidine kinase dimerization/phosphoacceptor domain -containing protein [Algoriphagus sp.]|uniref:histidine kinase dimerization/phosphoacceptor domain -containing protein n=1 Tax=Algoriphagus sp. TaxID=1872435 RepID=UPI003F71ACF0
MSNLSMIQLLVVLFGIFLLLAPLVQQEKLCEVNLVLKQPVYHQSDSSKRLPMRIGMLYLNQSPTSAGGGDSIRIPSGQIINLSSQPKSGSGLGKQRFLKDKVRINLSDTVKVQQKYLNGNNANQARLLLELGKNMLRTPYTQRSDQDRALETFHEAERISEKIGSRELKEESLSMLGVVHLIHGNWERGKSYFMQVVEARRQAGDKAGEINALLSLATTVICDSCGENIEALKHALRLSEEIEDQSLEAVIRIQLGYKYLSSGNTEQAEEEALKALSLQEKVGFAEICRTYKIFSAQSVYNSPMDYAYLSSAYYLLSDIGQNNGDLNQKLFYILKVVDDVEKNGLHDELDYTFFRLGNAYWELGQYDRSLEYHKQSAAISRQKGEFISIGLIRRMTAALVDQGKAGDALLIMQDAVDRKLLCTHEDKMYIAQSLGACYNALKKYSLAEKYYLESIAWTKQSPLFFKYLAYRGIAQFYVTNAQYSKAEPYLTFLENASTQQLLPNYLIEVHLMRFKVDSARQNYPAAIRHYQLYKALQDSIYNETKNRQIAQLSIEYETAKKEQDIQIKEKNIELLKEQNKLQQNHRNALFLGTGLLLVILALGFNRYRLKQRANRQLQAQQQILQLQQKQIGQKNKHLAELITEKDAVLVQKDNLLKDKDQLLTEKGWLLREIHHRVKNNFHVVASLLEIQSSYLKNKVALSAIKDSQRRIHSMSIIHQKLYQSDSLSIIHMPEYIYELVDYLRDSYAVRKEIGFSLEIENIALDHAVAITLGLILNEAITNALKYAFTKTENGNIAISLGYAPDSQILLMVQDNGSGLPRNFRKKLGASMGMELLKGLTDDIGGNLSIENNHGTCIKITFYNNGGSTRNMSIS